jgi:hypothetical protein
MCAMIQSAKLGLSDLPFPSANTKEAPREHTILPAVALISSPFLSVWSREDACDGCARNHNCAHMYRGAVFSRLQFHRVTVRPFSCTMCGQAESMFPKLITELSLIRQHPVTLDNAPNVRLATDANIIKATSEAHEHWPLAPIFSGASPQ